MSVATATETPGIFLRPLTWNSQWSVQIGNSDIPRFRFGTRGSQVLDRLPGEQGPVGERRDSFGRETAIDDLIGRTRLALFAEHIGIVIEKGVGFSADRLDVFYAPRELPLSGGHL